MPTWGTGPFSWWRTIKVLPYFLPSFHLVQPVTLSVNTRETPAYMVPCLGSFSPRGREGQYMTDICSVLALWQPVKRWFKIYRLPFNRVVENKFVFRTTLIKSLVLCPWNISCSFSVSLAGFSSFLLTAGELQGSRAPSSDLLFPTYTHSIDDLHPVPTGDSSISIKINNLFCEIQTDTSNTYSASPRWSPKIWVYIQTQNSDGSPLPQTCSPTVIPILVNVNFLPSLKKSLLPFFTSLIQTWLYAWNVNIYLLSWLHFPILAQVVASLTWIIACASYLVFPCFHPCLPTNCSPQRMWFIYHVLWLNGHPWKFMST